MTRTNHESALDVLQTVVPLYKAVTEWLVNHKTKTSCTSCIKFYKKADIHFDVLAEILQNWSDARRRLQREPHLLGQIKLVLVQLDRLYKRHDQQKHIPGDETYPNLRALANRFEGRTRVWFYHGRKYRYILAGTCKSDGQRRSDLIERLGEIKSLLLAVRQSDGWRVPFLTQDEPVITFGASTFPTELLQALREHRACSNDSHPEILDFYLSLTEYQELGLADLASGPRAVKGYHHVVLLERGFLESDDPKVMQAGEVVSRRNQHDHYRPVSNLCDMLEKVAVGNRFKVLLENQVFRKTRFLPDSTADHSNLISLEELLRDPTRYRSVHSLMEEADLLALCYILATAVFTLVGSSWLKGRLRRSRIFFRTKTSPFSVLMLEPLLMAESTQSETTPRSPVENPHASPLLLDLGAIMLQIIQKQAIRWTPRHNGPPLLTAVTQMYREWTIRTPRSSSMPPRGLENAIAACIHPDRVNHLKLDTSTAARQSIRNHVYKYVLSPLHDELTAHRVTLSEIIKNRREAAVIPIYRLFDGHSVNDSRASVQSTEDWLQNFEQVRELINRLVERQRASSTEPSAPIKIAVLDTGLKLHPDLRDHLKDGRIDSKNSKAFLPVDRSPLAESWMADEEGHGTIIAQILLDLAPKSTIHIARVIKNEEDFDDPSTADALHQRIANAITRATFHWEVDIIIMSFGFPIPPTVIVEALNHAKTRPHPPLIFAATNKEGANKSASWPAIDRDVFAVSSTDGHGVLATSNPNSEEVVNIVYALGESIKIDKPWDPPPEDRSRPQYVSGTSYANAVAASLVANLLWCVRAAIDIIPTDADRQQYSQLVSRLETVSGLEKVIRQHLLKKGDHNERKSLLPWDFLNRENYESGEFLRKLASTLQQYP